MKRVRAIQNGTKGNLRIRLVAIFLMLLLVFILAWSISLSLDELRHLSMEIKILETELARKDRDFYSYEQNTAKLSKHMRELAELKQKIPPSSSALYRQIIALDELMESHDLAPHTFNSSNILPGNVGEYGGSDIFFSRLELGAFGTYSSAIGFINSLLSSNTFYDIERVVLRSIDETKGSNRIDVSIAMSLYYMSNDGNSVQDADTGDGIFKTDRNPFEAYIDTASD